jgi:hypothetical protein
MNENWGNTFVPLPFHLHTQTTHPEAAMSLMKTTFCALVASSSLAACSTMDGWDPSQRNAAIGGAPIDQTVEMNLRVGPLTGAMMERPDLIPVVGDAVRSAISPYLTPKGVLMPAAVWIVSATKD